MALRSTKDFSFLAELDSAVGKAIRVFGPPNILRVIPLNLTGTIKDVQLEQSWLLPLLRDYTSHTELNHFLSYFLPIAFQLQTTGSCLKRENFAEELYVSSILAENLREQGDVTNSTILSTLQDQIWSLFPAYCSHPTDISSSFKLIAKGVGTSLTKRADLRLYLLAGLRNLITKNEQGKHLVVFDSIKISYRLLFLVRLRSTRNWQICEKLSAIVVQSLHDRKMESFS